MDRFQWHLQQLTSILMRKIKLKMLSAKWHLSAIAEWLKANKLSLNMKKKHYMIFHGKGKPNFHITLRIDGESINEVDKTKFLRVIIDNKLTWKSHITHICGKVARGIGIIIKARKWLNQDSLISLYYSFIYPYFIYCNHVWGTTCKTYIEPLSVLQKKNHSNYCGSKT